MLTKDEQDALDKVIEVYLQISDTVTADKNRAVLLTQVWAQFAKKVKENN